MASIRPKNGKWTVDYRAAGKRFRPEFDTKEEAQKFKRALELRPLDQLIGFQPINQTTIYDGCNHYFEKVTKRAGRPAKSMNSEGKFLEELNNYLAGEKLVYLHEVELLHMEGFQIMDSRRLKKCKHGTGETVDPNTVNRKFDFYHHVFERFRSWNFIQKSPMTDFKRLPTIEKPKKMWNEQLVAKVFNEMPQWLADIYWFMAMTGCRAGAASALNFGDLNFNERTIDLRTRKGKGSKEKIYKSPMTQQLLEFFQEHMKIQSTRRQVGEKDPVFNNCSRQRVTAKHLSTEMWRTLHNLDLKGYKLHGLRDTFCTLVANSGGIHRAKLLAGHSDIKTTQIYYRESGADLENAAAVIPFKRKEVSSL